MLESILVSDDLIYEFLGNQLSHDRITEMLSEGENWKWLSYAVFPVYLSLKIFLILICLSVGSLIIGVEETLSKFFVAIINAEFIFLIPPLIKLLWFTVFQTNYSLSQLQNFSPLSAYSLIDYQIEPWITYPTKIVNLFELAYCCLLAYQIKNVLGGNFARSLGFVASTYVVGLIIWVLLVMFLMLTFS